MVVYFIQRASDQAIKIGYTSCLNNRKNQIKYGLKSDVKILCVIDGGRQTEQLAHKQFNKLRIEGEWFLPGEELLEYLDAMQNNSLDIKTILKEERYRGVILRMSVDKFENHKTAKQGRTWEDYFEVEKVRSTAR